MTAAPCWSATFTLKPQVTLNGPYAAVADLLEPAPEGKLGEVKVKDLGPPGSVVKISRDFLLVKIKAARLGPGTLPEIQGLLCEVKASEKALPGAELAAFGEKYLREALAPLSGSAEVEVKLTGQARDFKVPDRPVQFKISPRQGQGIRGNVALKIDLLQASERAGEVKVGSAFINYLVKVREKALVAAKPIGRGEALSAANTALELRDTSYEKQAPYASLDAALGLAPKQAVPAGKLITPQMLQRPALIKRGDIFKLHVRQGMISVEVQAKALRDGAEGDSIPVEVQGTKKQLQAVVIDARTAVSE